jgi:DNA-directed RNA polymerase I and III subunit RPAC1
MHAVKGIGQDHAKFSPVGISPHNGQGLTPATASYRLLPTIDIVSPITGEDAEKFVKCFPPGVAAVKKRSNGTKQAEVLNPRLDTVSREVLRHDEFKDKVKLGRVRDHFICTPCPGCPTRGLRIVSIESVGILPPDELFLQAVSLLQSKCQKLKSEIEANRNSFMG